MGKPVERQNLSRAFFALAWLIALCTAYAFWDEFAGRRPWKQYQERIFEYERIKAEADVRYYERRLASGELKVTPDPSAPQVQIPISEAGKRLRELDEALARRGPELASLEAELGRARARAAAAAERLKALKSEDDALFWEQQRAQHGEMLAQVAADANEAARQRVRMAKAEAARAQGRGELAKEQAEADAAAAALAELEGRRQSYVGERERLALAIEAVLDPVQTARAQLEAGRRRSPEIAQYWLTGLDGSVDRCQSCHAAIDRCGFTRPSEILAALAAPNAQLEEVSRRFCVNPEVVRTYKDAAADLCRLSFTPEPSAQGAMCFEGPERKRIADRVESYCGPGGPGRAALRSPDAARTCLDRDGWVALAPYVIEPEEAGLCGVRFSGEGDACVEGTRRDALLSQLQGSCGRSAPAASSLERLARACASGDAGRKLAAFRPVLFAYPIWAQTHPHRAQLFGSHPPEKFGCTSCHEGQGSQTKGVGGRPFAHGYDDPYWERPLLDLVSFRKYRPRQWGPPSPSEPIPAALATHQEQFVEATCAKCHAFDVDLPFADAYNRGRQLAGELGCQGCHPVSALAEAPSIGPALDRLRQKTSPGFLERWIAYPGGIRPRTRMPHFWPEALDGALRPRLGSKELALREDEVRKISAYLWSVSERAELPPPPLRGDAGRGRVLVQSVGCRACHALTPPATFCTPEQVAHGKSRGTPEKPGACEVPPSIEASPSRDFGPNLSGIALATNERWLYAWLRAPKSLWPGARMPSMRLSERDASDIAAYLMTLRDGEAPAADPLLAGGASPELAAAAQAGSELIRKYGCAGCHAIPGHAEDPKVGTELDGYGRKSAELMDFGNAIPDPRHHTWYDFVDLKLRAPHAFRYERVDTRMPQYDLSGGEVDSLMTFLRSLTGEQVPLAYRADADGRLLAVAQGDQVLARYNCRGCHVVDGKGGAVRDAYLEDDLWKTPPVLQMQGWRTQPGWLFAFLHDPSARMRPWLDVRMPTFGLTDAEATSVVRGFAARARVPYPYVAVDPEPIPRARLAEAKALFDELRCLSCHTAGAPPPGVEPAQLAPNLDLGFQRLRPDWVAAWIRDPQSLQEGTRMPSYFTPEDPKTVMYPRYFGGSQEEQIQALADYSLWLGAPPPSKPAGR